MDILSVAELNVARIVNVVNALKLDKDINVATIYVSCQKLSQLKMPYYVINLKNFIGLKYYLLDSEKKKLNVKLAYNFLNYWDKTWKVHIKLNYFTNYFPLFSKVQYTVLK